MSVREVGIAEAIRLRDEGYRVVDVREPAEWDEGHVTGALHLPLGELATRHAAELPDRAAPLLLYCRSGARSGRAAAYLGQEGYSGVVNLAALITEWEAAGGAWERTALPLTAAQERRYARQLLVPEVGVAGQQRLLESRVLIVGAGGLGSPVALYLTSAGVGTIGVVDDDAVEESNLQRQVLHSSDRLGWPKVESAAERMRALNPEVSVVTHAERLDPGNAERLIGPYDVIVDASDNFETRYAVNDVAVRLRRPVVHGSVYRWEGQVTTLVPYDGPCYRCIHPVAPPAEIAPACDVVGVLGVLPGIVGTLQATEVLKLLLGAGDPLVGRLLLVDARAGTFDEVAVQRDPDCPSCGGS